MEVVPNVDIVPKDASSGQYKHVSSGQNRAPVLSPEALKVKWVQFGVTYKFGVTYRCKAC